MRPPLLARPDVALVPRRSRHAAEPSSASSAQLMGGPRGSRFPRQVTQVALLRRPQKPLSPEG